MEVHLQDPSLMVGWLVCTAPHWKSLDGVVDSSPVLDDQISLVAVTGIIEEHPRAFRSILLINMHPYFCNIGWQIVKV